MGRPKKAFRNNGIDIAAWENDRGGISFTLRKTYKNRETGEYKETKYFFLQDLKDFRDLIAEVIHWNETLADREAHEEAAIASPAPARAAQPVDVDDDIPF